MRTVRNKNIYVIAGPNGAGKSTFATKFLSEYVHCPQFVNADLIAQGLSPFEPRNAAIKAGRLVLEQIQEFTRRRVDFAFESTLAGKSHVQLFKRVKQRGYRIHVFFLWIPNTRLALERIKDRVAEGGHAVPARDVRRRFERSLVNFWKLYRPLVDSWMLFDNSGTRPRLIAQERDRKLMVVLQSLFSEIVEKGL